MIAAAPRGYDLGQDLTNGGPVSHFLFIVAGLVVFVAFIFAARFLAHFAGEQLRKRQVRADMVVLGRRAVTALVILLGLFAALGFAVESANITLFGLLIATIVAALGVQDLLRDYVSGYYVLFEHHIRVGDHIGFDGHNGVVTEVRLRVTMLKSDEGDVIVVPNSELFTKPVTIHGVSPAEEEARKEPPA
jgi:small-conductance mechanosensitive channel